jgi:hypothetical protein
MTTFLIILFVLIVVLLAFSLWVEVYVKPRLEYLFDEIIEFIERPSYLKGPLLVNKRYVMDILREQRKLVSGVEEQLNRLSKNSRR